MKALIVATLVLQSVSTAALAQEELVSLQTRPEAEQRFLFIKSPAPAASVILFAGGKGTLKLSQGEFGVDITWGRNNFLVRSRNIFAAQGFNVAVVDAPSDRQAGWGMRDGFRTLDEHVTDIDAVIADLRQRANVPVWLIGTSRGTESATHIAIHSKQQPNGLVLTSSMSEMNSSGTAVTEMALDKIKIPTLIVAHKKDGCWVTPPEGAEEIRSGVTNALKLEVVYFEGGDKGSNPCSAKSYHGFFGIEDQVIERIAAFINSN